MNTDRLSSIDTRALPLWAAALPLVTVNVCYLIAVMLDHLPACIPYVTGCTSISSTGRIAPESLFFRAGMLPTALILMFFWFRCATFLRLGGQSGARLIVLRVLGVATALSLMIYALTLGFENDSYPQWRRAGIVGFVLTTFAAQALLIAFYRPMRFAATEHLWRWLVVLWMALPGLDIASELAKWIGAPRHFANNWVVWNAFIVVGVYYAVVARIWRHHELISEYRLDRRNGDLN